VLAGAADGLVTGMGGEGELVGLRLARGCRCFAAFAGEVVAGYGWLSSHAEWIGEIRLEIRPKPGEAYIWNCLTLPAQRRRGMFRAVIIRISTVLQAEGFTRLWIAIGGGGRVITIDDRQQTIRSDAVQLDDLLGVAPLADGVLVVGRAGTVQRQGGGGWGVYASGIDEDLYGVAAFGPASAWAVGASGVTYRLEPAGWRPVATGVTGTLRAIAARAVDDAVVVGDDAVILMWSDGWKRIGSPVQTNFRAALRVDDGTYLAGDQGTLLRLSGGPASPVFSQFDLGTTCTLRAIFGRGTEIWVIGSDGGRAAVWRLGPSGTFHWGQCP